MNKENGGQAFPTKTSSANGHTSGEEGMTLRDYFASAVMQSQFSFAEAIKEVPLAAKKHGMTSKQYIAFACYEIADAMLEERRK